jgi:hypothetical protein
VLLWLAMIVNLLSLITVGVISVVVVGDTVISDNRLTIIANHNNTDHSNCN